MTMRTDIHSIEGIEVRICKSDWDESGWMTFTFDTKNWGDKEAQRSPNEINFFVNDVENCFAVLRDRLERAIVEAREKHAQDVEERKAREAEREAADKGDS